MSTVISGNTPSSFGDDVSTVDLTANDITANSLTLPTGAPVVGYQQGTWTATPDRGSVTTTAATWMRIGNQVTVQGNLRGFTDSSTSADIQISGLPYSRSADSTFPVGSARTGYINYLGNGNTGSDIHTAISSSNYIKLGITVPSDGATPADAATYVEYARIISAQAANSQLVFSITYLTDDTTWTPINGATVS
jgi:hypothetical protein